ncbi:FAD-dependent oxidoreductase [soil metagenome]
MPRPVLLCVDDEREVLRAVERDLRRKFGDQVRIVGAGSGQQALDVLKQLKERKEQVAIVVTDQRMPGMSGVETLTQCDKENLFPEARRILLTAYADTDAAIAAINDAHIDHYLLKPWDPPEQKLYPYVEEALEEYRRSVEAPFEGIRIAGSRWSPETFTIRDYLARNQVPYRWIDVDQDGVPPEAEGIELPAVLLPDGGKLSCPTLAELAEAAGLDHIGLQPSAAEDVCDLAIVGAGPAGLAAAVYGASEGLTTCLIERDAPGGQAGSSSLIENYLGFPRGVSGADLARRSRDQAVRFGVRIVAPREAVSLGEKNGYRLIRLNDDQQITARSVILAMGVQWRRLDAPGEDRLNGRGVYYGAGVSEGATCEEEDVFIIGGANSAGQAAMEFSRHARKVTMIVRGGGLAASMSKYLSDRIEAVPNIEVMCRTQVKEFFGESHLEGVRVESPGGEKTLEGQGCFIFIGAEPKTEWLGDEIQRDGRGFILAGSQLDRSKWKKKRDPMIFETSVPGVFVAGDVRSESVKRVASSVGQGSIAVQLVHEYLKEVGA